ncbi:RNA polymerase sigma factor [bacterium 210917-DFI.7.65]|nr:RNA polymerase sigma factor [bacterium 210917-DFI.7.65]
MEHSEFSALYRRWYRPMLLYARSLTGDLAAAEDLVQNAFAKALLSYRAGGSVRAWLATVLRNEFLSQKRREKMYAVPLQEAEVAAVPGSDPLEGLLVQEQQRQVYEAVLALPEAYRETIVQSAVLGLSDAEIAALRGISQESVRQLRHRARVRLKRMLKEEEP